MMTSINRTYTPSTGNYKTPKNETESSFEMRADKKLITLLKDREKFEALAGKDNILTVKEAADWLKNNGEPFEAKLKELKVNEGDIENLKFAFERFAKQQRNMALAKTDETNYNGYKFLGVTFTDIAKIDNDFRHLETIEDKNKDKKGFNHFGNVYARRALPELALKTNISYEDYNVGDGLTNVLNELSSKEESTASTVTYDRTDDRTDYTSNDDDTSETEKPKGFFNSPLFAGVLGAGLGFLASLFIKK